MKTNRFHLKEIQPTDIQNIHKGLSDPVVTEYYDVHFPTLEATQEQMDWYADLRKNETGIWWSVYSRDTNTFCGAGGYNSWDKSNQKAEIGFWLLPEYWGKGIMQEVMPCIFQAGFQELDLNRIEGFVLSDNIKCKKALEKIHFKYEGTMQECEMKNGKWIDIDIYAILKKNFRKGE